MAAPRLNDSQKEELVARYRQGETAQALAAAYGCSPNTVSRVLKAALDPAEMASIKRQSRGRSVDAPEPVEPAAPPLAAASPAVAAAQADPAEADPAEEGDDDGDRAVDAEQSELAIDDADDFAEDGLDDGDSLDDCEADDASPVPAAAIAAGVVLEAQPLIPGVLPASVYMLVDKTVELQAKPLRDFPELGTLPEEEQQRQALMLFTNPRQAKRQCGRTQRVIKVPDAGVLERRSSYLVAQGITRLVVEGGSLFALAGS
jgi:hypothetical protein